MAEDLRVHVPESLDELFFLGGFPEPNSEMRRDPGLVFTLLDNVYYPAADRLRPKLSGDEN